MHFLEHFYKKIVKYDLINKYHYNVVNILPKLKKIILNFNCKSTKLKILASSLLALELIGEKKSILTTTKSPNIILKIRKGNPVGCKIILRKKNLYNFIARNVYEIFLNKKNLNKWSIAEINNYFSYKILDTFIFNELEKNYDLFKELSSLDVTYVINSSIKKEFVFIFKSFKFPFVIKNTKNNLANITQMVEYNLAKVKVKGSNPFICSK